MTQPTPTPAQLREFAVDCTVWVYQRSLVRAAVIDAVDDSRGDPDLRRYRVRFVGTGIEGRWVWPDDLHHRPAGNAELRERIRADIDVLEYQLEKLGAGDA